MIVVDPGVAASVAHRFGQLDDAEYLRLYLKPLKQTNPLLYEWIVQFARLVHDRHNAMLLGLVVYQLIESQLEADKLKEELQL